MSAYYRTINGQRYDADLLEMAEGLMEGHGDGRLSLADVEALWEAAFDGMGMTAIEMATLNYIRENENPTRPAKEWLDEQGIGKGENNTCLSDAGKTSAEMDIQGLRLMRFFPDEIKSQEELGGKVPFVEAFQTALAMIFDAKHHNESPYAVVKSTEFDDEGTLTEHEDITEKIQDLLDYGVLFLVPLDTPPNPDANMDYYPPENGEKVADNWIFNLTLDELSDHLYWMVVPGNGGEAYVYGFN